MRVAPAAAKRRASADGVAGALDDLVVVPLMEADRALAEDVDGRDHLDRPRRATHVSTPPC